MPTYVESIAELLQDQMVEVYIGDQHENVTYADNVKNTNSVLCGRIVKASGDVLVLNSFFKNQKTGKIEHGNIIYINGYNVILICQINGDGTLRDALHSINDSPLYQPGGKHVITKK